MPNGQVRITAPSGYQIQETFEYTIMDEDRGLDNATVSVQFQRSCPGNVNIDSEFVDTNDELGYELEAVISGITNPSYTWEENRGAGYQFISGQTSNTLFVDNNSNYSYRVTVNDNENGCVYSDTFIVP